MSKIYKNALTILITFIILLGIQVEAQAASNKYDEYPGAAKLNEGDSVFIKESDYDDDSNYIYCIEHKQRLHEEGSWYSVESIVNIEGLNATGNGKTVDSILNAKLAYILGRTDYSQETRRNVIWNEIHNWVDTIGVKIGVSSNIKNNVKSDATDETMSSLKTAAENYAKSLKNTLKMTDNKTTKTTEMVTISGKSYIKVGPFNWTFPGKLSDIKVYNQNGQVISNVIYSKGTTNCNISDINSGKDFYLCIPATSGATKIGKIYAKSDAEVKTAKLCFLRWKGEDNVSWQNLMAVQPRTSTQKIDDTFTYDIPLIGNLAIIKANSADENIRLAGVGFKIKNADTGKYIRQNNGQISYVSESEATEFVTDDQGKIEIKGLLVGNYVAYETKNPNYGYEIDKETTNIKVVVGNNNKTITNTQKYIKLSGIVWVDKQYVEKGDSKTEQYNDYYNKGDDTLLDGITVKLKDKNGNIVKNKDGQECITQTANGGTYIFEGIEIEKIKSEGYYVEFEYNGLTYTNVVPHLTTAKEEKAEEEKTGSGKIGSKSAEGTSTRESFNNKFSIVEAGNTENTSITRDTSGNQTGTLTYNLENDYTEGVQKATLITNTQEQLITAKTTQAGYKIEDYFVVGETEIKNINLGLKLREQPDMALYKDLDNVRVSINGHGHTYKYAQRFKNRGLNSETGFNVGVKYEEKYNTDLSYTRAIYKEDALFESTDNSKELKVSMTYAIKLVNQSENLTAQINSIIDYYDSKYTGPISIGRTLNEDGTVVNDNSLQVQTQGSYGETGYNKVLITTNSKIEAGKADTIYVQFDLNREAVVNILNNKNNLNNVAEIYSYSIFDKDGKVYAGIDKDSNPGSCNPTDKTTYQDDTDRAPEILLEVADARKMSGSVFVDATSGELQVGQERLGNGIYDEGEVGVPNVHITLTETSGTGLVYEADTDENGNFEIASYIPGSYTLTYTWGDKTYKVQNYKGTIYNNKERQNDAYWYYDEQTRNSDAMDNWETRQKIDDQNTNVKYNSKTTIESAYEEGYTGEIITKMDATTPSMAIEVENNVPETDSTGDRYEYTIDNIDLGLVERARQEIALTKRVKTVKLTLANGTVLSDAVIEKKENGEYEVTGKATNYITHEGPSSTTIPPNGFVKLELDTELMQGATLEVGYEFTTTNNSELDYLTEEYYKYGENKTNVVTITPKTIIDYLDSDWGYEENQNPDWEQIATIEELQDLVDEVTYKSEDSNIANTRILYTDKLKDQKLEPAESTTVNLNVSKLLSASDDVELDNEAEIVEVEKTGGSDLTTTPGNYIPGTGKTEADDSMAETTIVTPNTGNDKAFIVPTIIGIISLGLLATGVVLIKKFILKRS